MRCGAERGRGDGGAALVELAIALPLLAMLVFGVYAVGRGYHAKVELTSAVREGARAAALRRSEPQVVQAVIDASPGLSLSAANVRVLHACPDQPAAGENAEVQVTYSMTYSIPFVQGTVWTMTEEGVMRCGL